MAGQQITGLTVEGYKSFGKKQHLQIRPLTLLAGANSSGKSSVIQPLLLLKQTLDAPFDPGALKIDGPNVAFSWNNQMFTHMQDGEDTSYLKMGLEYLHGENFSKKSTRRTLELEFNQPWQGLIDLAKESVSEVSFHNGQRSANKLVFTEGEVPHPTIEDFAWLVPDITVKSLFSIEEPTIEVYVEPSRCFLDLEVVVTSEGSIKSVHNFSFNHQLGHLLTDIIYVPGLRDPTSVRSYPLMPIGERFPGPLHSYLASIIYHWGSVSSRKDSLGQDLRTLGLATRVWVKRVDDTALQVLVDRNLPSDRHSSPNWVDLADVGLGLSQVLPVLAALRVARPHHLVVMEQPELHLHPRGIHKLAEVIVGAVSRGVRIIMETHSELLLLGIQTLVAKGRLDPAQVSLNWFSLDGDGHTLIRQAEVEKDGSFGNWPVDFLDVELSAQRQYLDAVSNHE